MLRLYLLLSLLSLSIATMKDGQVFSKEKAMPKLMYSYASYCPVGQIHNWNCFWCNKHNASAIQVSFTFNGEYLSIGGYAGVNKEKSAVVFAFRGTKLTNVLNYLEDLSFLHKKPFHDAIPGAEVHGGFLDAYMSIRAQVNAAGKVLTKLYPNLPFVVTGHSLGAAIGTLAAADLAIEQSIPNPVELWTFGSPRVGNPVFSQYIDKKYLHESFRVTNNRDPVPRLPPAFLNVQHIDTEYWFTNADTYKQCGTEDNKCNAGVVVVDLLDHGRYLGEQYLSGVIKGC